MENRHTRKAARKGGSEKKMFENSRVSMKSEWLVKGSDVTPLKEFPSSPGLGLNSISTSVSESDSAALVIVTNSTPDLITLQSLARSSDHAVFKG